MSKTIKEVADMIGVSKTAIRKYMDDDFKSAYTTREGEKGPVIISDEGVTILKEKCKGKPAANQEPETTTNQAETTENHVDSELLSILQGELETLNKQLAQKDAQLAEKDRQIQELTESNKNLSAANNKLTDSLQAAQALNAADKKLLLEATTRKSFWSRIFGRKKQPVQAEQPNAESVS